MRKLALFIMLVSSSSFAELVYIYNAEIMRLGTHKGQVFYMTLNKPIKSDCAWGNLYCPISDTNCENYYSMVLAAKMANKSLGEVRYTQDPTTKRCDVWLVAVD